MNLSGCEEFKPVHMPGPCGMEEINEERERVSSNRPGMKIHSARHNWVEFSLPCSVEAANQLPDFLVWFFAELQEEARESVMVVLRELLLNAIEWGGKSDVTKEVRVSIQHGRRAVLCRVADPGKGFRLDKLNHAAICNPEGKPFEHMSIREQMGLRPGGFGLEIIRANVDELIYNDAGNEVVFLKFIEATKDSAAAPSNF